MAFFIFFLLTAFVYAERPPQGYELESMNDFSLGLNTRDAKHKLLKGQSPNIQNFLIDEKEGSLVAPNGFTIAGSTATLRDVRFLGVFNQESGNKEYIVSDSSVVLATKDFTSYTLLKTGMNRNLDIGMVQARNKAWIFNGSDPTFTYDGSTVVVLDGGTYSGTVTPNVPRGKHGIYYQERMVFYNLAGNNSGIRYTSLVDTNSLIIALDDSRAWDVENDMQVGQGDGTSGTGLWIERDHLFAGKEKSIYTINGTNEFNFLPSKTDSSVGLVSQQSVVSGDGTVYFLGDNGINFSNSGSPQRVSDLISPDIELVKKDISRVVSNTWDSQADFSKGDFSGTTATVSGLLQVLTSTATLVSSSDTASGGSEYHFRNGSTATAFFTVSTATLPPILGFPGIQVNPSAFVGFRLFARSSSTITCSFEITGTVRHSGNGKENEYVGNYVSDTGYRRVDMNPLSTANDKVIFSNKDILDSSFTMRIRFTDFTCSGSTVSNFPIIKTATTTGEIILLSASTGQFISEITTVTTLTAWASFNATINQGGGDVDFFYKSATSTVNIATRPWIAITPGSVIGSSATDTRIMWASTIASPANVDVVSIDHIEGGGSNTRAFGAFWKNRYHLYVSTVSDGSITIDYVKSKITNKNPHAFTKLTGINLRSILVDGDVLYGGFASSGTIFRLDFGTNYNGQAIDSIWDSPDQTMGNNYQIKDLYEYRVDVDKSTGSVLTIGNSIEGGVFNDTSVALDGSGRLLKTIPLVTDPYSTEVPSFGKFFTFRLRHNSLDKPFTLHDFSVVYKTSSER